MIKRRKICKIVLRVFIKTNTLIYIPRTLSILAFCDTAYSTLSTLNVATAYSAAEHKTTHIS